MTLLEAEPPQHHPRPGGPIGPVGRLHETAQLAMVSGPPERPRDTTRTGCTPWRQGSWARPSNGPETYKGCNHVRVDGQVSSATCGYPDGLGGERSCYGWRTRVRVGRRRRMAARCSFCGSTTGPFSRVEGV